MKILSWNCFGAGDTEFLRATGHLLSIQNPDIFVLLEPRLPGTRAVVLGRKLGFSRCEVVEAEGFSGGIWIFYHDSRLNLDVVLRNRQFLHARITGIGGFLHNRCFEVSFVYVRPQMRFKRLFMSDMVHLKNSIVDPWVMVGDFNCIKSLDEKQGGSMKILNRCQFFVDWINDMEVIDLGFQGPIFTWRFLKTRKRVVYSRLAGVQRALANRVTSGLIRLERKLLAELDMILIQEEIFWFQKSRVKWLNLGDRNTSFFHLSTVIRRKRNKILGLRDANGIWQWDAGVVQLIVFEFFQRLYTEEDDRRAQLFTLARFPELSADAQVRFNRPFVGMDVYRALFSPSSKEHAPILLDVLGSPPPLVRIPFRFEAAWITHSDFVRLRFLKTRKRVVYSRLAGVQRALANRVTSGLIRLERKLLAELDMILIQEEIVWFQKSRVKWLNLGDRNTSFFHLSTVIRRKRNKILGLRDANGIWQWDAGVVQLIVFEFFQRLYTEEDDRRAQLFTLARFPELSADAQVRFNRPFVGMDVYRALFDMGPFKAPGPDGFQAVFFQKLWRKAGPQVTQYVLSMLQSGKIDAGLNETLITIIPKVPNPEMISQFRPISLCNVLYKLVTKCVVNRIKEFLGDIIGPAHSSFVPGRHISDNVILVQEAIHSMHHRSRRPGDMIIKLDMEKAYDRVSWFFLRATLSLAGFSDHWVSLIMSCVEASDMKVLWNGEKLNGFKPSRGLRQRDPLSSYLFVLCIERLGHMIEDAVSCSNWSPISISRGGVSLSHVFFADDIVLMAEASIGQAVVIKNIMRQFSDCSGQKVNHSKSKVFFSPHISDIMSRGICDILGVERTHDLGVYLGMPLMHGRVNAETFSHVVDKVCSRITGWKVKNLSFVGRLMLIKSVTSSILTYSMQTVLLPSSICSKLDACNQNFLWGSEPNARKIHLVNWNEVCKPKNEGGLGIRDTRTFNLAMLAKLSWKVLISNDSLWVRALRAKYGGDRVGLNLFRARNVQSSTWRGILAGAKIIKNGVGRVVYNVDSTFFWKDKWCGNKVLLDRCTHSVPTNWVNLLVRDFWIQGNGWNWPLISNYLSTGDVCELASVVLFFDENRSDSWNWPGSKSGIYTIKHDSILCNENRRRRHISSLDDWPYQNLIEHSHVQGCKWSIIFSMGVWWIWKSRNRRIFYARHCPDLDGEFVMDRVVECNRATASVSRVGGCAREERWIRWIPPEENWVKINSDGASKGSLALGHHECGVPPAGLQDILEDDRRGRSERRNVVV
ncbi:RNA binding RNA-directed DNA polymerase [Euphorbia peplus]|nr:RNA binding RNA-directed DNA polymerase [Euphorbia peplus]